LGRVERLDPRHVADHRRRKEHDHSPVVDAMFHYNFIRIHQTIRCTPAMAAGVTDHLWSMLDLVALIEARERLSDGIQAT
jgi:hypothetical protein